MAKDINGLVAEIKIAAEQLQTELPSDAVYAEQIPEILSNLDNPNKLIEIYNSHAVPEGDTIHLWNQEVTLGGKRVYFQTLFTDLRELLYQQEDQAEA